MILAVPPWMADRVRRLDLSSLRIRFAVVVAGTTALALITSLALENAHDDQIFGDEALVEQGQLAANLAGDLAEWVDRQRSAMATVAGWPGFEHLTPAEQATVLGSLQPIHPDLRRLLVYDATGQLVASTGPDSGPGGAHTRVFEHARQTLGIAVAADASLGDPEHGALVFGAPLLGSDGEFRGVVVGESDVERVSALLRREAPSGTKAVYVLDGDGQVIEPLGATLRLSPELANRFTGPAAGAVRIPALDADDDPGSAVERLVGFAPVADLGWHVVVERPTAEALASVGEAREATFRQMVMMIAIAALVGALAAGSLVAPLRALSRAAERLAAGASDAPLPRSQVSEVAQLASTFLQMRERLAARTTEREQAETALRETNRMLAALVSASPLAVVVLDPRGAISTWNPAAERLFGWTAAEVIGRPMAEILGEDAERLEGILAGAAGNGIEIRRRTRAGQLVDVAVWTASLEDSKNGADGAQGRLMILADIAERKRLDAERTRLVREQAERAEAEALRHRLEFLADASTLLNQSLELESTVETAVRVAVPELADWCTIDLVETHDAQSTVASYADPAREEHLRELRRRHPFDAPGASATSQAIASGNSVLIGSDVNPIAVLAVPLIARDRTIGAMTFMSFALERRYDASTVALAEALARRCAVAIDNARLYREAQEAVHARDTFLSIASHELGSPLARMKAYTEVLLMAQSHEALNESLLTRSLRSIDRATDRLATITQDLLDVSRLRLGELPMRRVRLNVAKLVRDTANRYAENVDGRHQLKVHIARGAYPVRVDPGRMEQVIENLLSNAVKYSPEGGEVRVTLRPDDGGVLLQVQDEGIGLPPGAGDAIFEPFGRASNADRRSLPGMGLGLYICRSIVERHGGRIWAESPGEQRGTTISIWLPLASATRTA